MSGFAGIVNLDGLPVDRAVLERMTQSLAFRGPDGQQVWRDGAVGLGHALLRTAREAAPDAEIDKQPAGLDGRLWIVADARIDARAELIAKLKAKSSAAGALSLSTPDAELILHAYDAWGDACAEHLLGDFSFALWDAPGRRLFCARDHFGIRLFYYARTGNSLIFSNTLDCLRFHPGISDRLNGPAIADFLMFDANMNMGTTTFADILRLPPAHTLQCAEEDVTIRRYWTLPEETPLHYQRPQECLDHFQEVFDSAVSDRLRGNSAGLLLSGGLDSPTVAASAKRVTDRLGSAFDLRAYTHVHEKLIPHEEKYFAGLVAQSLGIPIRFLDGDNCRLFDIYDDPKYRTPEPTHFAMGNRNCDPTHAISAFSRLALAGYGGDPALASLLSAHFRRLFKARNFGRMLADAAGYLTAEGRYSRLYVRTRFRRWFGPKGGEEEFFPWLNPEFVERLNLRDRWAAMRAEAPANHSARPEGYESVASPYWTTVFESDDASISGSTVEVGYPFFDLRVLKFLLALPALPWCSDKEILRRAARGVLPDAVRLRKKSPLLEDPITALLRRPESAWVDRFEAVPELHEYVLRDRIPKVFQTHDAFTALAHLRPLSLNYWLQRRRVLGYKL